MKIFPENWNICEADTVCIEIVDCINKTAPVVEGPTSYKMIRTTNVRNGRIDLNEAKYVEEVVFNKWTRRVKPRKNDIILTREAPLGEVGLLRSDENVMLGQRTMLYRANSEKLDQHFLYYSMIGPYVQAQIRGQGNGSTVEHLRVPDAKKLKIPVAPLSDQRKISVILSSHDDLIEINRHRIKLLERMAEELYREWFVRMRFPGHEQTKFKKGIPVTWGYSSLGKVANFVMGQSPKSEFYNANGDGLPFNQGVGTYGERFPFKAIFCSSAGRKAKQGDILFSVRAPVGRLNIADCEMIIGRGLAAINHKSGFNSYLFYLLKNIFANEDIIGNGAIFNSVGKDELHSFSILKPDDLLIKKFNDVTTVMDEQISLLIHSNEKLTKTKDMLLRYLITGKLSVTPIDIHFPSDMREVMHAI
jgi:type I restriction enzyme, S subunit